GENFFAVGQHDGCNCSILDLNVLDFRVSADFGAGFASRLGDRAGERTKPAPRKRSAPDGMRIRSRAKKKHRSAAGGPRSERGSKNTPRGHNRANQLGLEELADKVGNRHRAPAKQIEDPSFTKTPNAAPRLEQIPEVFGRRRINGGRSDGNEVREDFRDLLERSGKLGISRGVFRGKVRDTAGGLGMVI